MFFSIHAVDLIPSNIEKLLELLAPLSDVQEKNLALVLGRRLICTNTKGRESFYQVLLSWLNLRPSWNNLMLALSEIGLDDFARST